MANLLWPIYLNDPWFNLWPAQITLRMYRFQNVRWLKMAASFLGTSLYSFYGFTAYGAFLTLGSFKTWSIALRKEDLKLTNYSNPRFPPAIHVWKHAMQIIIVNNSTSLNLVSTRHSYSFKVKGERRCRVRSRPFNCTILMLECDHIKLPVILRLPSSLFKGPSK